jgi:hypothetical protein
MTGKWIRKAGVYALGLAEYVYILVTEIIDAARGGKPQTMPPAPIAAPGPSLDERYNADVEHLRALGVRQPEAAARAFADLQAQSQKGTPS